ncbi:unnamed protein product [Vitrella brassicaformis CCMP3155]|uniref:Uncharacterized protein n=2 Tax=Vitrella brassicaformis TaxID=1169539 RepID=A0A0G4GSJ5_VITBC|nr:unnamed protein product [Vitrella brassicaformis CCMP3155]|mmetsp:Transcript_22489/g.55423  ORF Transcript_22489/g.55423 Transcript_22489/m.55423 type:complete len:136 (+) Transcript_22489:162-569(+)|eukprot:CEM33537.1 unnamed protein product [Vitrella brassicaformis CCMP3155]
MDHEKKPQEVLKEVKKAKRPNEPRSINLSGIQEPEWHEETESDAHEPRGKERHEKRKDDVVYPYESIIVTTQVFEKCVHEYRTGESGGYQTTLLTPAVTASDKSKGITWGDFLKQASLWGQARCVGRYGLEYEGP